MTHAVSKPKARYNPADGSVSVDTGNGIHHFADADIARQFYAACVMAVGLVDPATSNGKAH